jgi:lysophospholipase L1-like esterase
VSLTQFVASSGAFHPNAQGHAATADAIRDVIEKTGALK